MSPRKIALKYEGRCRRCGKMIPIGARAYWEPGIGVWHPECTLSSSMSSRFRISRPTQLGLLFAIVIVLAFAGVLVGSNFVPQRTTSLTETERRYTTEMPYITPTYTMTVGTKATPSSRGMFVGSRLSNIYHYPSCYWARQINPKNEIWFKDSADARAHGYRPCKVCRPP